MLVSLISLVIMMICISMIRRFNETDKRVLYVSENDLARIKDKSVLVETEDDVFSL